MTRPIRLAVAGFALAGAAVGAVLVRRWAFPVRERSRDVGRLPEAPRLGISVAPDVQREDHGMGPRFHRRYRVRIGTDLSPEALMGRITADLDAFVPVETARFEKTHGDAGALCVGDEFEVHPTGPWRAPVRVAACDARSFTLVTLDGHMEAGQIRFSVAPGSHRAGTLVFTIESWARSATPSVHVAYDTLGLARKAQQATWTTFCNRVAEAGGGRLGPVDVLTERETGTEAPPEREATPDGPPVGHDVRRARHRRPTPDLDRYRARLEALTDVPLSIDLDQRASLTTEAGWHVDHTEGDLPPEPPGDPLPAGAPGASWATACALVRDYAFPDPALITGLFAPDGELAGRTMLLRARFLGLTFWFGVRVTGETDETVDTDAGPARDWGYGYATLEGHFEKGEITFRVRKETETGRVRFLVDSVSRPDVIRNPFYRAGFALFGRRLQLRFARTAVERMQALTAEALAKNAV